MDKILSIFKSKAFIGVTGVLAVAALVWYIGPLIAIAGASPLASDMGRVFTILTVGGVYGLTQVIYYINTLRTNRNMLADLAKQAGLGGGAAGGGATAGGIAAEPSSPATAELIRDQQRREDQASSAAEISTLKQGLQDALGVLKKARLGGEARRGQYLYQLPWYIIIGPPGSGKTTALVHSGLRFPLGAGKVRGVGGTRNCDWWFTDEAVLIDTAGRYTTQDSHEEVDRAAWRGFLDLLKKHRSRRPINGAFVAISLSDLMQQTEEQRTAQAIAIKQRIQELHEHFGVRFPIYVLFTKTDLLAGFVEFFNDLGQEERHQVWGATFEMDDLQNPEGAVERFSAEFALLEERLNQRLVHRLQNERDTERRDLIYTFPQQFASLRQVAERFMQEIFRPSRFEERVLLRGFYFTSGTQQGTPIDRLMGALANTFGLHRHNLGAFAGKGRSYFITRLLRSVVFPESEIAGTNLKVERWRAWMQRAAYLSALLITLGAAALWLTSYARNEMYIRAVEAQRLVLDKEIAVLSPDRTDPIAALPVLNAARALPGGYAERAQKAPWLMGFGLYQGEKLGGEARRIYESLLLRTFLPRIVLRIEERLREATNNPGALQNTLQVYLMLDDAQHFDAKVVQAWMEREWQIHLSPNVTRAQREQLSAHLAALLALAPLESPIALDSVLINNTRKLLNQVPVAQRVYESLKSERGAHVPPDITLSAAAGPDAPRVFERKSGQMLNFGIPGLYSYAGYFQFFLKAQPQLIQRLAGESWIFGPDLQIAVGLNEQQRIADDVCRFYFGDFLQQWQNLLSDLQIKPFTTLDNALEILQVLSAPTSPLQMLAVNVARETALDQAPAAEAPKAADSAAPSADTPAAAEQPEQPNIRPCTVDPRLMAFNAQYRSQVQGSEGTIPPFDKTMSVLGEVYSHVNALARAAQDNPEGGVPQTLKDQINNIVNQLQVDATRKPVPFNTMLNKLAQDSAEIVRSPRDRLNAQWQALKACAFFQDNLQGRYPFVRSSIQWSGGATGGGAPPANSIQWVNPDSAPAAPQRSVQGPPDASLTAFSRFFAPNGLMDGFFRQALKLYVDPASWSWRGPSGADQSISAEALQAFQRAAAVRTAFFPGERTTPLVRFRLTPLQVSGANQAILKIDGQTLSYSAGQAAPQLDVQWPGATPQARLEFLPTSATPPLEENGPWAWLRLLDQAQVQPNGNQMRLTFQSSGAQAIYDLALPSEVNPFRLRELEGFRCPEQL